jgi:Effector-associated domain 1
MTVRDTLSLSGEQAAQLRAALMVALPNRPAVELFMDRAFRINLNAIVPDVGLDETFFRVFTWARANGKLELLLAKACEQFPDNHELKAAVDKASLSSDAVAAAAGAAEDRVDATRGLVALEQLMQDADVREAVGDFQSDFKGAASQIEVLGLYKDLHDLLHTLQFQCYKGIAQEAKRFPDDESSREILADYELTLDTLIHQLEEVSARAAAANVELAWLQDLRDASKELNAALAQTISKPLVRTVWLIDRVLAVQPSQINTRLNTAARALRLSDLVEALTLLRDKLTGVGLDPVKLGVFSDGIDALVALQKNLTALVIEHDRWQTVDLDLRRIQVNLRSDVLELELSWDRVKGMTALLCTGQEPWATSLRATCEALANAIASQDQTKERQTFQRLYTQSSERFYLVDTTLKRLCESLRTIAEPLNTLLRILK